jgi:hypothetical protein
MSHWKLRNIKYLSEGSYTSINLGQTPVREKYLKVFKHEDTGLIKCVSDLQSKIHKRNNYLNLFIGVYGKHVKDKTVTILTLVINQERYSTMTKFINTISRKLKRKGIARLGYVWVRDVGDKEYKHFHLLLAISRINQTQFDELFCGKSQGKYEVQFKRTKRGMINYLIRKDLFAANKQRAFAKSMKFNLLIKKVIN